MTWILVLSPHPGSSLTRPSTIARSPAVSPSTLPARVKTSWSSPSSRSARHALLSLLSAILFATATSAGAMIINLHAELLSANENNPANTSPGVGIGRFVLDTTALTLRGHIEFSGLLSGTTASHIHCCQTSPPVKKVMAALKTATCTGGSGPLSYKLSGGNLTLVIDPSYVKPEKERTANSPKDDLVARLKKDLDN